MITLQMVLFAIYNLSERFSLLGKDLFPSPFLLLVLLCFAGILRSAFVLLRCCLGNAKLVDLRRECKDLFLFLGWCTPSFEEHPGLEFVFSSIHKGSDSDVSSFNIGILLALDEQCKFRILSSLIPLEDIFMCSRFLILTLWLPAP
jgi:hypothetical protein